MHRKAQPHSSLQNAGSLAKKSADIPRRLLGYLSGDTKTIAYIAIGARYRG